MCYVELLEKVTGRRAEKEFTIMQLGYVKETFDDIEAIRRGHGFDPKTGIDKGIPRFIAG